MINEDEPAYGEEVELVWGELVWGEPDGGSANPTVERHAQTAIRVTVSKRRFSEEER